MSVTGDGQAQFGLDHKEAGAGDGKIQGIFSVYHFPLGKVGIALGGALLDGLHIRVGKRGVPFKTGGADISQVVGDNISAEQVSGHITGDPVEIKIHSYSTISCRWAILVQMPCQTRWQDWFDGCKRNLFRGERVLEGLFWLRRLEGPRTCEGKETLIKYQVVVFSRTGSFGLINFQHLNAGVIFLRLARFHVLQGFGKALDLLGCCLDLGQVLGELRQGLGAFHAQQIDESDDDR